MLNIQSDKITLLNCIIPIQSTSSFSHILKVFLQFIFKLIISAFEKCAHQEKITQYDVPDGVRYQKNESTRVLNDLL